MGCLNIRVGSFTEKGERFYCGFFGLMGILGSFSASGVVVHVEVQVELCDTVTLTVLSKCRLKFRRGRCMLRTQVSVVTPYT